MSAARATDQLTDLVRGLLELPRETPWVEDKENNTKPDEIGGYMSALSNAAAVNGKERGYLLWGVRDGDRQVVGTRFEPMEAKGAGNEDLVPWLTRALSPQVYFEFHEITYDDHRLVLMEVERARTQPVCFKGEAYIRVGSYKKKLSDNPGYAQRLWKSFDETSFEVGMAIGNLGESEILGYLDYPAYFSMLETPLPEARAGILAALAADDLIKRTELGRWDITNLGAILFAKSIEQFPSLRRKAVRVIQYQGTDRISTIKEQVGTRGYASGFEGLISYINTLLPSNEVIGQALRTTVKMYPELAIRELIANALIHQDFTLTGTGPTVEIFDDRIEITNPGQPLIDPLRFVDSPPRSRNEGLASLMRRCGVCEERGSGWDKIAFEIEFNQLPAPLVELTVEHTKVTLFSHKDLAEMDRGERVRAVYLHACLRHVTHKSVTNSSIRERFGINEHDSYKASRIIKEALDQGRIVVRDPSAGRRFMTYVPWWAAPDPGPNGSL